MIKATANSGCGVEKYSSNSASVVAVAANANEGARAAAAAPAAACNPAGDFVADAASRGHGATRIGRSAAQMWQPSSNFSSRIMCAMCCRHFYRLTDENTHVFAAVGPKVYLTTASMQE